MAKSKNTTPKPSSQVEDTLEPQIKEENTEPIKRRIIKNSLTVTLPDGTSRTYSPFTHGRVWETLAKNFAEANDGEIS